MIMFFEIYSVSQKKILPLKFCDIFPNGWEFLVQILHAYYSSLSRWTTTFYSINCNFDEIMPY